MLFNSVKLLKLIGVIVASVGSIMFLKLPIWRLDLANAIGSLQF